MKSAAMASILAIRSADAERFRDLRRVLRVKGRRGLRPTSPSSAPKLAHMPANTVRPYIIEEYTKTVCPTCFEVRRMRSDEEGAFVDGMLVTHDGSVWMRRFCPTHGESESLYEEDAEIWRSRNGWSAPTLTTQADRQGNHRGFPDGYREGLPSSHGQHTCILLLNVTENCNYRCPTCYAGALGPGAPVALGSLPSIEEVLHTADTMLEREAGKLGVVMISGGEPTLRTDLELLLTALLERNITRVMLNTNGRRIARDDRFLTFLESHRDRIEVYLQMDGLRPSTHLALRGEDVVEEKLTALRRLSKAGVFTTLVATVAAGVNEDEMGDLVRLGLETKRCCGLAIQPMFGSGRAISFDPSKRATPTGVLRRLKAQTGGLIDSTDFIPLPCSHRDCCDIAYLVKTRTGWRSIANLIGREELRKWIHLAANTISFENASEAVKELIKNGVVGRVFAENRKLSPLSLAADILRLCECGPGCDCLPGLSELLPKPSDSLERMAESTFRITVKMFMDSHTFHEARIRQCCVHVGTYEEDPRRHSFCWRWLFDDAVDFPERRKSTLRIVST